MKAQCSSSDIISTLPQNIIEKILCYLPIQNAVATSILSSKWRYSWTTIPALTFDDELFQVSSNSMLDKEFKFVNVIFRVLFLHKGPLLHFTHFVGELSTRSEVDLIILYLSKSNTLKSFYLVNTIDDEYKIPSVLSSFQLLEDLSLECCYFELPSTFNGLGMLRTLTLSSVVITSVVLQRLLINCPQLKKFVLKDCAPNFGGESKFTFVDLCEWLPSIVHLEILDDHVKYIAEGAMPRMLSTSLVHLKVLHTSVCFVDQDEVSLLLCMIRASPNLKKINIWMWDDETLVQEASMNFFDLHDYSSYTLNHLKYLEIEGFKNLPPQTEFVKLIMAKSPILKKVQIKLKSTMSVNEEVKMLRDFVLSPFPRASPSAKVIIKR